MDANTVLIVFARYLNLQLNVCASLLLTFVPLFVSIRG